MRVIPDLPVEAFQKCYENWKKGWNYYVISEEGYFKSDYIDALCVFCNQSHYLIVRPRGNRLIYFVDSV